MDEHNFLDKLEDILIKNIQSLFVVAGKNITYDQARNILANIGTRVAFSKDIPKKQLDELILSKS